MKTYYVYIITNKRNGTLYIGVTNDLERRLYEHRNKTVPGFTSKYYLNTLVYLEEFISINDAISAEKIIKGWTRLKKINLIEKKNPNWLSLDPSQNSG